jgi:hypothetical protein
VSVDPRVAAAERALAEHGVSGAMVEVEGHEREIAALRVPEGEWERMMGPDGARLADAVKAAGFRYVALDLLTADAHAAGEHRLDDADDEGPAGWDAFDPPDDATPREAYPPLSEAERRAAFRALACLLLGLTAVEVVRAAVSPGTPWLPLPGVALQVGMSALAGYASTRHLRQLFFLPFAVSGAYLFALAAGDAVSAHDRVITPNQLGLHEVPLIAAALAGGLLVVRTRRAAAVVT